MSSSCLQFLSVYHIFCFVKTIKKINVEQVYQLSAEFKQSYPEQPWDMVAGLRHRLVHDYDGINWPIIVEVVYEDMNPFVQSLKEILDNM